MARLRIEIEIVEEPAPRRLSLQGRPAWALLKLDSAGEDGCTPIDTPGPRWSDYVFKLRKVGIDVATIDEPHGGQFAGTHARYVLRSRVNVLSTEGNQQVAT
jgi:hypothetical protein